MHYALVRNQLRQTQSALSLDDVTVVVCLRISEKNAHLPERLRLLGTQYAPRPKVLVVDFGSETPFSTRLAALCREYGFAYLYEDDKGVYCPAKARNAGAANVATSHVFFMDPDFVGVSSLFADLVTVANSMDMAHIDDAVLMLPVYHLNESHTEHFFDLPLATKRTAFLREAAVSSLFRERGRIAEFVAPYSNNILCSLSFFAVTGGYNEHFRGHGSEDFEFLLRCCLIAGNLPLPSDARADWYGPMQDDFYESPPYYRGFRRLFEVLTYPAEASGLKMFHLWHEKDRDSSWIRNNDWKRARFNQETTYLEDKKQLIDKNWLPKRKTILVLLEHADQTGYFLPLRRWGYSLELYDAARAKSQLDGLKAGKYAAVAIFNPYMASHAALLPVFELAKAIGCRTLVVERGALPDSLYYAPAIAYEDSDYQNAVYLRHRPVNPALTREYMETLRSGQATLEANGAYGTTLDRYAMLPRRKRVCFIPLQLEEDVATTCFMDGFQSYKDFLREVESYSYDRVPEVTFFIKKHPLSKRPLTIDAPNVVLCSEEDNVHALLELADTVICYNSGVGLLALAHGRELKTIGNAFYNRKGVFGKNHTDFQEAVADVAAKNALILPDPERVLQLYDWLLFSKYAFFRATSKIVELAHRRIHGYTDVHIYQAGLDGHSFSNLLVTEEFPLQKGSYLAGKLHVAFPQEDRYIDLRSPFAGYGWHQAEPEGRWAGPEKEAGLILQNLVPGVYSLEMEIIQEIAEGLIDGLSLTLNGKPLETRRVLSGLPTLVETSFTVTEAMEQPCAMLVFRFPRTVSPATLSSGKDTRKLAVQVRHLRLRRMPE